MIVACKRKATNAAPGLSLSKKNNQGNIKAMKYNKRRKTMVIFHFLRLPGVLARQQVIFGNQGETLSLIHDSIDRLSFMPGLILCCQKVTTLNSLYYGLEYLLSG